MSLTNTSWKFAANLSTGWMFNEAGGLVDRLRAAVDCGFDAVEIASPYTEGVRSGDFAIALRENGAKLVLLNSPLSCQDKLFRDSFPHAIEWCLDTDCRRIHVMAGSREEGEDFDASWMRAVDCVRWASESASRFGIQIMIEGISLPNYVVRTARSAFDFIEEVGRFNVEWQLDAFHAHKAGEDIRELVKEANRRNIKLGHVQVSSIPDRNEPIDCFDLFPLLDSAGFCGHCGCEYRPAHQSTKIGLKSWIMKVKSPAGTSIISRLK